METETIARIARAVGHPTRIRILRLLAEQNQCCGAELFSELSLPQSTVSQHLAVLKSVGLIGATPRGTSQVYCITPEPLITTLDEIARMIDGHPKCPREEPV